MLRSFSLIILSLKVCCISGLFVPLAHASTPFFEEQQAPRGWALLRPAMADAPSQLDHANALRDAGQRRKAQRQYRALVRYWPTAPEAAAGQLAVAQLHHERGRDARALEAYGELFDQHAGQFAHDQILEELFAMATAVENRRRGQFLILPGWAAPERALPIYDLIVRQGPRWHRAPDAQLRIGLLHENQQDWEDAILAYDRLIHRYPRHALATDAAYGKARALTAWALEFPNHIDGLESAMQANLIGLRDYPDSEYVEIARANLLDLRRRIAKLEFEAAQYYDRVAIDPQVAVSMYELFVTKHPESQWAEKASQRMAALQPEIGE